MHDDALLAEQMAYYKAGAAEYDRPYAQYEDLQKLLAAVDDVPIAGHVLELACGTGQWTPRLAARAQSVTAVDASPEVLALARARTASPTVQFLEADLFKWQPARRYDTVFFIDDGPAAAAYEEVLANQPTPTALRRLDDGSQYRIVKVFHDAQTLTDDLTAQGWSVRIRTMAGNFIGIAEPPTTAG